MRLGEWLLLKLSRNPDAPDLPSGGTAKSLDGSLRQLTAPFPNFLELIAGREVLDFGCGLGFQANGMAKQGAGRVVGVDISEVGLENGRKVAAEAGLSDRVSFVNQIGPEQQELFDVVVSLNSMEHFGDPQGMIAQMNKALKPGGIVIITFAPPWYAPYGAHMYYFTRLPWVHLLFSERTVLAVRSRFRSDGAARYEDIEGGLNRMSLKKFWGLVKQSGLTIKEAHYDGVKGMGFLTWIPGLRELFTNRVSCVLEKPAGFVCGRSSLHSLLNPRQWP